MHVLPLCRGEIAAADEGAVEPVVEVGEERRARQRWVMILVSGPEFGEGDIVRRMRLEWIYGLCVAAVITTVIGARSREKTKLAMRGVNVAMVGILLIAGFFAALYPPVGGGFKFRNVHNVHVLVVSIVIAVCWCFGVKDWSKAAREKIQGERDNR